MYLLDTNVFISAKNDHYGFDFCPAFWDWLLLANKRGIVFSIQHVRAELLVGEDPLVDWVHRLDDGFFLDIMPEHHATLGKVGDWAHERHYSDVAVQAFAEAADSVLIALALELDYAVVTHETSSTSIQRVKIPDACKGLGVKCLTPFQMLRQARVQFVLGESP